MGKQNQMKKPNAILMGEAINEEARAAHREDRAPSSTNVIKIFTRRSRNRLSYTETLRLFDFVFNEYQNATGAKAISLPLPRSN
jgi:hypothetical protein